LCVGIPPSIQGEGSSQLSRGRKRVNPGSKRQAPKVKTSEILGRCESAGCVVGQQCICLSSCRNRTGTVDGSRSDTRGEPSDGGAGADTDVAGNDRESGISDCCCSKDAERSGAPKADLRLNEGRGKNAGSEEEMAPHDGCQESYGLMGECV
jgi:hypothetical protein